MSLGSNIKNIRKERKLTQEQIAEKLGVSFQAVSSWERDEYKPDVDKLRLLAKTLDVSVSSLVEEENNPFTTKESIYNWEHMKTYVKTTAKNLGLTNTLKALDFAVEAHKDQKRKKSEVPYIYHPLNLACHALAMNIIDDDIIAACLLHDVIEDCGKSVEDLPVDDKIKSLVLLLSHEKTSPENRDLILSSYYKALAGDPKAALIKCLDRCNNLTTMAGGLSRDRMLRMIKETEEYFPDLLYIVKSNPEYNNSAWLLQYQMESMLDIYKRLL